jgi:hypothetical protein
MIWVLVVEKIATLQEIETHWSLDDVIRAHDILHMRAEMNEEQRKKVSGNRQGTINKDRVR